MAVAGFAVNGLAYAVPVLGARRLSAADLGALATVLALGAIASVAGLGLQAALAVRWAREGAAPHAWRVTLATAAVAASVLVVATPLISANLHLSPVLPSLLAVMTASVVVASRFLGELQGRQRFAALAACMLLLAVVRYGGVLVGVLVGAGVVGSIVLGAVLAWLVLPAFAVSHRLGGSQTARPDAPAIRGREVATASAATFAMLAISYADLIVARAVLPAAESGAYAVGAVLSRGAMWAPQVVTVLALPRLAQGSRRALLGALAIVGAGGVALVSAAAIGGGLAVRLAGGPGYAELSGYAAGFAAVGALYALVFVFVNAEIAASARLPAGSLWLAIMGLAVATRLIGPPTLRGILILSLVTAALTTLATGATVLIAKRPQVTPRGADRRTARG